MSRDRVFLEPEDIEAIAREVAARVQRQGLGLVTVDQLAAELQVERAWVYRRWRDLGGFKLGAGRNAPIRFDLTAVRRRIQGDPQAPAPGPSRQSRAPRPRPVALPDDVELLTARGA